ncbi:hypothetical protein GCM10011386_22530 [Parapedobacter defluvii]|uniref:Right handed beta helix region n=1 Tax=Parapedobacter defluvii TaxID=2045106 RepID=A0ABQ1LUH6_9SPHI|nr:hypothetical protein GCM10011386_22530 [Parapedobacter defluvii]
MEIPPKEEVVADDNPQQEPEKTEDSPAPNVNANTKKITLTADDTGRLVIDGNQQQFDCNTTIAIKAGQYNSIVIRNLNGNSGCPIRIENDGLVEFVGLRKTMSIANVSHITISGNGTQGIERGFLFRDNEGRAVELSGDINHFTYQYVEFKNIGDYVISYNNKKKYDGSTSSYAQNLTFTHLKAVNTASLINFPGEINGAEIEGLIRKLEISYIDVSNCPIARNVVYIGLVEDYDVHDNTFTNINAQNDNHNAMFLLMGNGKFYNNHISKHQGNAIRAWAVSIGSTPKEIHIFNNIVVNSRKYSAFEVQSVERHMIPNKTTYVNAKVYHNTCGGLNELRDWYGVVVDAYRLFGGQLEVYNNLAFDFKAPHPKSYIVSYMSLEEGKLKEYNNLYFPTSVAAGFADQEYFKLSADSKAYQSGVANALNTDIYTKQRNKNSPSVGAVE